MFVLPIDYYTFSLFAGGSIALLSGLFVFFNNRRSNQNVAWLLLNIVSSMWSFGYLAMLMADTKIHAWLANWILHAGAILIPVFYLLFILYLTKLFDRYKHLFYILIPPALFFLVMNTSPYFVRDVIPKYGFNYVCDAGYLYTYFTFYFFIFILFSLFVLIKRLTSLESRSEKKRLLFIMVSSFAGFVGGGSVFFMTFNIPILPHPVILFALYPILISYSILKYKLFSVKVISTELLTATIWVALAARFVFQNQDRFINGSLSLLSIIIGVFIIRSVAREVSLREEVEKLAENLEKANEDQTNLIYFITHQVKGFFTKSRGIFSALVEEDFGTTPDYIKPLVKEGLESGTKGVMMVQEVLDASNIRKGTIEYNMQDFDLSQLVKETYAELKSNAESKGLNMSLVVPQGEISIHGDELQLKQVVKNLIDNAIRYTLKGEINVSLAKQDTKIVFSVKDSGVGITDEDKKRLFTAGGRGKESRKVNVDSTGFGLYIVRKIVEAHGGKISATSTGLNQGSTFTAEFPVGGID